MSPSRRRDLEAPKVPELQETQTFQSLLESFAREASWFLRLGHFATMAEYEGYPEVLDLLQRLREASRVAAEGHLDFLRDVDPHTNSPLGTTTLHLAVAVAHEREDVERRYVQSARTARSEGLHDVASWCDSLVRAKQPLLDELATMMQTRDQEPDGR